MPSLKRKRDNADGANIATKGNDGAMGVFRRHFESQFGAVKGLSKPAKQPHKKTTSDSEYEDSDSDDSINQTNSHEEWGGLEGGMEVDDMRSDEDEDSDASDGDDDDRNRARQLPTIKVVEYDYSKPRSSSSLSQVPVRVSKREFMSSKPPRSSISTSTTTKSSSSSKKASKEDDNDDAENLQNDLTLQRLIRESHLLDSSTLSHATGKNRQLATEMRIQSLGGKPIAQLDGTASKVPMHIRKGIAGKADEREKKRRATAKEAGIVLEKAKKKKKKDAGGYRDRGVGVPSMGKFRGGALVLSKKDVAELTGGDKKKAGKGKRKGKR